MQHGFRAAEKPSQRGGFACVVCNRRVARGDPVVGFRNTNKPDAIGWDHVCAEICADQYRSPPVAQPASTAPSTSAATAAAATSGAASSSGASRQSSKEFYFELAQKLGFQVWDATAMLEQCNGDFVAAGKRLSAAFVSGSLSDDEDGSAPPAPFCVHDLCLKQQTCTPCVYRVC